MGGKADTYGAKAAMRPSASTRPPSNRPAATDTAKAPPKKGSFADTMARAALVNAKMGGQLGKIQHKKIEKVPSKKEREEMSQGKSKNLQKNLGPGGKFEKAGQSLRDGISAGKGTSRSVSGPPVPEKKVKKAALATTGYTGTARPKPGGNSKGPSRPSAASASSYRGGRGNDRGYRDEKNSARYAYVSDDEAEEEPEEEEDYASDGSSDMEAGRWDMDEEEDQATRIAKAEDAAALREENKLKREKEEKRKRLAKMAASRR